MKGSVQKDAEKFTNARHRRKLWYKVMTCLAAVVVFCTTYALILPAITIERKKCEIEEHIHTEECYEQQTAMKRTPVCTVESLKIHRHDESCYDENGKVICGYADFVVHTHNAACFDESGALWCPLPEVETHIHDFNCYEESSGSGEAEDVFSDAAAPGTEPKLICEKKEIELHIHDENCLGESGEPEFLSEAESTETGKWSCGKIEVREHVHTDACFEYIEVPGEMVLTCGKEEHTHSEECQPPELPEGDGTENGEPEAPEDATEPPLDIITPEPSVEPENPEEPEATVTPEPSEESENPEEPEVTVTPGSDGEPENPEEPEATVTPEPDGEPENPEEPEVTVTPEPDGEPENPSEPPLDIITPAPSVTPEMTVTPEPSVTPEPDEEAPEPSEEETTPEETEPSVTPEPDEEGNLEKIAYPEIKNEIPPETLLMILGEENANSGKTWLLSGKKKAKQVYRFITEESDGTICIGMPNGKDLDKEEFLWQADGEGRLINKKNPEVSVSVTADGNGGWKINEETQETEPTAPENSEEDTEVPDATEAASDGEFVVSEDGIEAAFLDEAESDPETDSTGSETESTAPTEELPPETEPTVPEEMNPEVPFNEMNIRLLAVGETEEEEKTYYCGLEEHEHGPSCYQGNGEGSETVLVCEIPAHTHSEICERNPEEIEGKRREEITSVDELAHGKGYILVTDGEAPETKKLLDFEKNLKDKKIKKFYEKGKLTTVFEESAVAAETLWTPLRMDAETQTLTMSNVADRSSTVLVSRNPEGAGWSAEPEGITTFGLGDGSYEFSVYATGEEVESDSSNPQCNDPNCELGHYLDDKGGGTGRFETPSGTNPFGGAQGFNLFVVPGSDTAHGTGSIHNWGEVHANAAIAGNICGTNQHIVYDQNSVGNYSADVVKHYDIGLLLGGMRTQANDPDCNTPAVDQDDKVVVRNGSVLVQEQYDAGINMELGLDSDHIQYVEKADLDAYFNEAAQELRARNQATTFYSEGLANGDAHVGTVRYLQESDTYNETTMSGDNYQMYQEDAALVLQAGHDLDGDGTVDTHGDDFYNVFNVKLSQLAPRTSNEGGVVARQIYLDVPFGSYVLINVVDDRTDKTVTPDIAPVIRYKDSNGKWIDQPADKSQNDDYTQTQRTLMNFAPSIEEVNMNCMGNYLYTSILAPNMQIHVPSTSQVQIQGTVVLDGLHCDNASNNSAILENPFMAGSQITLKKSVVCDSHNHESTGECFICNNNDSEDTPNPWDGYYADLTLTSVDEQTGSIREMFVEKLALDGTPWVINGLTPGAYQIADEFVYKIGDDGVTKIKVEESDSDLDNSTWNGHKFSHALFGENAVLVVESGDIGKVTIVNHYAEGETTSYSVRKEWKGLDGAVIAPPPGAKVELTLYRKVGESGSGEKVTMEGLKNPVMLSQETAWFHRWNGLPAKNDSGQEYIYYVVETVGYPGFEPGDHWDEDDQGSNTHIHVYVNEEKEKIPGAITVAKRWLDPSGNIIDPDKAIKDGLTAEMKLYRKTGTMPVIDSTSEKRSVTISFNFQNGPSGSFKAVPGSSVNMGLRFFANWTNADQKVAVTWDAADFQGKGVQASLSNAFYTDDAHPTGIYINTAEFQGYMVELICTIPKVGNEDVTLNFQPNEKSAGTPFTLKTEQVTVGSETFQPLTIAASETFPETMMTWSAWTEYTPAGQQGTVTLPVKDTENEWQHTWNNLPANNSTESTAATEWYCYFVFETEKDGYDTEYLVGNQTYPQQTPENAKDTIQGITEGQITVQNKNNPGGPELPMTGGPGTKPYTTGGILLISAATFLLYHNKKRRKEDTASS